MILLLMYKRMLVIARVFFPFKAFLRITFASYQQTFLLLLRYGSNLTGWTQNI